MGTNHIGHQSYWAPITIDTNHSGYQAHRTPITKAPIILDTNHMPPIIGHQSKWGTDHTCLNHMPQSQWAPITCHQSHMTPITLYTNHSGYQSHWSPITQAPITVGTNHMLPIIGQQSKWGINHTCHNHSGDQSQGTNHSGHQSWWAPITQGTNHLHYIMLKEPYAVMYFTLR